MTTYYAKTGISNLSGTDVWNTANDGSGDDWTYTSGENVLDLNGQAVTLDVDITVTEIKSANANGYLTVSSTRTITGDVSYSSTSTSGMVRIGTSGNLTVNGQSTLTAAGYLYVLTDTGALTLSNSGATALTHSNGRGISSTSSGSISITGAVTNTAATSTPRSVSISNDPAATVTITGDVSVAGGLGLYAENTGGTMTITGNVSASGKTGVVVSIVGGTCDIDGGISTSYNRGVQTVGLNATINWTGSRTLAEGSMCHIGTNYGTLNLATASAALTLANSGQVVITYENGTINVSAAGGDAAIVNQTATAQAAILNCTGTERAIVTGPTLPNVNNVIYGSGQFGYAGGLLTPNYAPPCNGESPYTADASKVLTTGYFGTVGSLTQGTGSGGGGYTYGDEDPDEVLTTATGAGNYQAVAASDVRKGVNVGVSPAVGTLVGIVDSGGTQHDYGTCSSAQAYAATGVVHTSGTVAASGTLKSDGTFNATGILSDATHYYANGTLSSAGVYNATGVIYGEGSYATEASRNTDPGAAYVLTGHDYTIAGSAKTAAYSPDFPAVGNVLSTDTVNGSQGTLTLPAAGYVLTSDWGGPAAYGVGGSGLTPTATLTLGSNVWHTASAFGASGSSITPAMVGSDIENLEVGNVKKNVVIDDVTGTYDPMAAAVFPDAANVSTVETAYGPTGAEYAGSLNLALYTLISAVVAADYVVTGHDNYTGGEAGTYPTTETSQAAQLATDTAEVEAAKASILDTATILGVTGTNPGTTAITVTSKRSTVTINSEQVDIVDLDVTPEE